MTRDDLLTVFTQDTIPNWTCPKCELAILHVSKENFLVSETEESIRSQSHPAWEPDWISKIFNAKFICTNPKCKEKVIVIGKGYVKHTYVEDDYGNQDEQYLTFFHPLFFLPGLKLFKVAESTPEEIKDIIFSSFELFFCNPSSSANLARIALERVIDFINVKTFLSKKGKRIRISLHERIKLLPSKYAKERDLFMAIKWLGNSGSHDSKISQADLIDLFEIFEKLLNEVFEKKDKRISKLAKEVNRRRGPKRK